MAKTLSVLLAASEIYPYAKETGVADYVYSLSLAQRELNIDCRVTMPKYGSISERKNKIHDINRLKEIPINLGDEQYIATVKSSSISNGRSKVQAYISTNHEFFDNMKGVYHDPVTWKLYPNNGERFLFFCKSVIQACVLLEWYPDIIHINDWYTALIPAIAKTQYASKFKKTKFVLSIHNFYNQGEFPLSFFNKTELPNDIIEQFKHKNKINLLKGAMSYADYITTVSKQYADEILNEKKLSNGLQTMLQSKSDIFQGIDSGIDKWTWNPNRNNQIPFKNEGNWNDFKYNNKVALINKVGFEYSPKTPLITMLSRIVPQKGFELVLKSLDTIFERDVQLFIMGQGDADIKEALEKYAEKYPDKLKLMFKIDDDMTHLTEAGSDITLITSEYEPVGLNFMYSSSYGSVPVTRVVGGIKANAKQYNAETGEGNSFTYEGYDTASLIGALDQALELYKDKEKWEELSQGITEQDFSWAKGAKQYEEIYKKLVKEFK